MRLKNNIPAFQSALREWYATAQRPLPWRTKPSLYRTIVSELMTQQTQIKTMLPYFDRWMQRFPDFSSLANATEGDVLKHWEGLGYYSRARSLHKLAQAYTTAFPKPTTRAEWQSLPGIGPYTSAAIASINFNEPVAVVDGNVVRVLTRLTHDTRSFKNSGDAVKALTDLAEQLVPEDKPGDHNQAMMELGATICLKRKPLCSLCPVREFCESYGDQEVEQLPRIQRKATERLTIDRAWIIQGDAILLHRIPKNSGQLAGQYELPQLIELGIGRLHGKPLLSQSRSITHRRITENIYRTPPPQHPPNEHFWVPLAELDNVTLSGPHRRWTKELLRETR